MEEKSKEATPLLSTKSKFAGRSSDPGKGGEYDTFANDSGKVSTKRSFDGKKSDISKIDGDSKIDKESSQSKSGKKKESTESEESQRTQSSEGDEVKSTMKREERTQ